MVAIASGKGGVGKTWLSITLASLVARSNRRVLLFDGDLGLANVDIQLGLTPTKDISYVTSGKAKLKDVITRFDAGGFDIIAGRSGSGSLATLGIDTLANLITDLKELSKSYDLVIIDLGAGVEAHVRYLAAECSRSIVVVTDEPTSLTDAYAFIKIAKNQSPHMDIKVVVNQASTQNEGEKTFETLKKACMNFLKYTPQCLGIVRRDPKVKEAIRSQTLLVVRSPNTIAATDTAAIALKLINGV